MLPSEAAALAAHAHARSAARTALTLGSAPPAAARRPSVEHGRAQGPAGRELVLVETNHEADDMQGANEAHAATNLWRPAVPSPPARGPHQKDARRPLSAYDVHGAAGASSLSPNQDHISEHPIVGTTSALTSPNKPTSVRTSGPVRKMLLSSRAAPGQVHYTKRGVETSSASGLKGHDTAGELTVYREQPVSSALLSRELPLSTGVPQLASTQSLASVLPPPPPSEDESDVGTEPADDAEAHFKSQEQLRPLLSHDSLASIPPPPPADDTSSYHGDSLSEAAEASSHPSLQPRPMYFGFGSFSSLPPPPPISDEESDRYSGAAGTGPGGTPSWRQQPSDIPDLQATKVAATATYEHDEESEQAAASTQPGPASMEGALRTLITTPAAGQPSPGQAAEFDAMTRPADVAPRSSPSLLAARAFSCSQLSNDMNPCSPGMHAGAGAGPALHEIAAPRRDRQTFAYTVKAHSPPSASVSVASLSSPVTRSRRARSSDTPQQRDAVDPGKRRGSLLHERIAATWKWFVGDADTVVVLNPAFDVLQAVKERDIGMVRYLHRRRASTPVVADGVRRAADDTREHLDAGGMHARVTHARRIMLPPNARTFATQLAITRRLMAMQQYVLDQRMLLNHFENRRLARELAAAQTAGSPQHINMPGSSCNEQSPHIRSLPPDTTQHGLPAAANSRTLQAAPLSGPTSRLHGMPESFVYALPERSALRAALQQVDAAAAASAKLGDRSQPVTGGCVPHSLVVPGQPGTKRPPQPTAVDVDPLAAIGLLPVSGSEPAIKPSSSRRHPEGELSPSAAVLMSQLRSAQEGSRVRGRAAQGRP